MMFFQCKSVTYHMTYINMINGGTLVSPYLSTKYMYVITAIMVTGEV